MVFFFKNLMSGNQLCLANETSYKIGRKSENEIIIFEPSVSKFHGKLSIHDNIAILIDLNSKRGIFVNDEQIETVILKHLDKLKFGRVDRYYQFLDVKWTTLIIGDLSPERRSILKTSGVDYTNKYSLDCTHITAEKIELNQDILLGLVHRKPIVSFKFWFSLSQAIEYTDLCPNVKDFVPSLTKDLQEKNIDLSVNLQRRFLFKGKYFIFFNTESINEVCRLVEACDGTVLEWSKISIEVKTQVTVRCNPDFLVIYSEKLSSLPQIMTVQKCIKSAGLRPIKLKEIFWAVLYGSLKKYCNPKYRIQSELDSQTNKQGLSPSKNHSTQTNIETVNYHSQISNVSSPFCSKQNASKENQTDLTSDETALNSRKNIATQTKETYIIADKTNNKICEKASSPLHKNLNVQIYNVEQLSPDSTTPDFLQDVPKSPEKVNDNVVIKEDNDIQEILDSLDQDIAIKKSSEVKSKQEPKKLHKSKKVLNPFALIRKIAGTETLKTKQTSKSEITSTNNPTDKYTHTDLKTDSPRAGSRIQDPRIVDDKSKNPNDRNSHNNVGNSCSRVVRDPRIVIKESKTFNKPSTSTQNDLVEDVGDCNIVNSHANNDNKFNTQQNEIDKPATDDDLTMVSQDCNLELDNCCDGKCTGIVGECIHNELENIQVAGVEDISFLESQRRYFTGSDVSNDSFCTARDTSANTEELENNTQRITYEAKKQTKVLPSWISHPNKKTGGTKKVKTKLNELQTITENDSLQFTENDKELMISLKNIVPEINKNKDKDNNDSTSHSPIFWLDEEVFPSTQYTKDKEEKIPDNVDKKVKDVKKDRHVNERLRDIDDTSSVGSTGTPKSKATGWLKKRSPRSSPCSSHNTDRYSPNSGIARKKFTWDISQRNSPKIQNRVIKKNHSSATTTSSKNSKTKEISSPKRSTASKVDVGDSTSPLTGNTRSLRKKSEAVRDVSSPQRKIHARKNIRLIDSPIERTNGNEKSKLSENEPIKLVKSSQNSLKQRETCVRNSPTKRTLRSSRTPSPVKKYFGKPSPNKSAKRQLFTPNSPTKKQDKTDEKRTPKRKLIVSDEDSDKSEDKNTLPKRELRFQSTTKSPSKKTNTTPKKNELEKILNKVKRTGRSFQTIPLSKLVKHEEESVVIVPSTSNPPLTIVISSSDEEDSEVETSPKRLTRSRKVLKRKKVS